MLTETENWQIIHYYYEKSRPPCVQLLALDLTEKQGRKNSKAIGNKGEQGFSWNYRSVDITGTLKKVLILFVY